MNEEQQKAFEEAAKPLMKYLAENHNPHTSIILTYGAMSRFALQKCSSYRKCYWQTCL